MTEMATRYDPPVLLGECDAEDEKKIQTVQRMVNNYMFANIGQWFTPIEMRTALRLSPDTEITARFRALRAEGKRTGAWRIEQAKRDGAHRYRLMLTETTS